MVTSWRLLTAWLSRLSAPQAQASNAAIDTARWSGNRPTVEEEWQALVEGLLYSTEGREYRSRMNQNCISGSQNRLAKYVRLMCRLSA
jgi:hypothetical protein